MHPVRNQLARRLALELRRNLFGINAKSVEHEMNMIWHDGARPDNQAGLLHVPCKTDCYRLDLRIVEVDSRILESFLRCAAKSHIVLAMSHRPSLVRFGGRAETIQVK